jgi:hypothetical protein
VTPESEALIAAARSGLAERRSPIRISRDDRAAVVAEARFDGLSGFLTHAIDAGSVECDTDTRDEITENWHLALTGAVMVEALTVRTTDLLDAAGVRWRLTKGAAFAHLDYPDQVECRTFGDADIVVHGEDWKTALDALLDAGHHRPSPELRPGFDVAFGKGATIVDPTGLEVDLHLRFAIGRFGVRSRMDELFARHDEIVLGGRTVSTLAGPDRLLHACHHLALGGFSGRRVARDIAQLLLASDVDWETTVATAEAWKVQAVVAAAIARAWERLSLEVDHPAHTWAVRQTLTRGDAKALEVFQAHRPFRAQALTAVGALPGGQVPRYLRMLVVPAPEARHDRSVVSHLRSRVQAVARRRRRLREG